MNQQTQAPQGNLGDVFELTRGEINSVINGLAEGPAKSTYALIKRLLDKVPVRVESVQATAEDIASPEVVQEPAQS